jgi:hypothetical protein
MRRATQCCSGGSSRGRRPRRDRSRPKLARAITLDHFVIEASLAQPGQHFIEEGLTRRDLLPGFREAIGNVARDEQRVLRCCSTACAGRSTPRSRRAR